jgi:hypothetical protein
VGSWEAAAHGADGEEKRGEKGRGQRPVAFYGGSVERAKRKMGQGGPGFGTAWREKRGRERGASGATGDSSAASIGPRPAGTGAAVAAR